jgi:hypothetical protein
MANDSFKVKKSLNIEPIAGASPSAEGDIAYNSTTHKASLHNGTTASPLVTEAHTQTLSNKTLTSPVINTPTISGSGGTLTLPTGPDTLVARATSDTLSNKTFGDAPTFTQVATPSTPSSGFNKIYPKSDGNFYTLNSSGIETQVGSGAGGGSKNYLSTVNNVNGNGNFELGSTTKWSLFNTTLTSLIPTGSITAGAASITTFSVVSSGQLSGTYSLRTASSAAWSAGQGFISDAFTIDLADQAKVMQILNYYKVVSGASNANFSGTSSNSFAVYIYDVTNSAWIQPTGVYSMTQNSGVGITNGTFQTTSNSTQYRLAIICINATAGAVDLYWDDFFLGPQIAPLGAAVTDLSDRYTFTPNNFGTVTNPKYLTKQIGDELFAQISFTTGTPSASTVSISLPSGLSIDSSKISSNAIVGQMVIGATSGTATTIYSSSAVLLSYLFYDGSDTGKLYFTYDTINTGLVKHNATTLVNSNTFVTIQIRIPIAGWSSNVVTSSSTDTRVVAMFATSATTSITGSDTTIINPTVVLDTHGLYNSSNGTYTIPVSGNYEIGLNWYSTVSLTNTAVLQNVVIKKNGTAVAQINRQSSTANAKMMGGGDVTLPLNAGDSITVTMNQNDGTNRALDGSTANNLSIKRLSGPSTITSDVTVAARYNTTAGQSIPASTQTIVDFGTKTFDRTGCVTTGASWKFTAPISGLYRVTAKIRFLNGGSWLSSLSAEINLYKNGSKVSTLGDLIATSTHGTGVVTSGSDVISLVAGDFIDFRAFQDTAGAITLNTNAEYNYVSIERIGN